MTGDSKTQMFRDKAIAREIDDAEAPLDLILDPKRRGSLFPYLHRLREIAPRLRTDQATGHTALTRLHAEVCHSQAGAHSGNRR